MEAPVPVSNGTGIFIIIALWCIGFAWAGAYYGKITKDSAQIITVIISTLTMSTWLLWLCAWMHQWHPLIYPIVPKE